MGRFIRGTGVAVGLSSIASAGLFMGSLIGRDDMLIVFVACTLVSGLSQALAKGNENTSGDAKRSR